MFDEDVKYWIIREAFSFLSYGIYAVLAVMTFVIFWSRKYYQSKPQSLLVYTTTFTFLTATAATVLGIQFSLINSNWYLDLPGSQMELTIQLRNIKIALAFMERMSYILSDVILVWRAWILFPSPSYMRAVLVLCMFVSSGTFVDCAVATKLVLQDPSTSWGYQLNLTMTLPLLITNITSTLLIGYHAWLHHLFMKDSLVTTSKAQKTLCILVESGSIYCLLWVSIILV
ncbi:hypothetical protein K435DRAFT_799685 [Dendrothele bispora CBS 962.96]|uniref:Integral membrane protein n=1 Tax=Dendrothele bispora (strain CBS 962.96) TaxID=1314807 RepID=A0A4S8LWG2_DENBC|nr:hypothetical protein K435DRAFT_799685 [Dendrothele bispora CBS 962.96]